jgi:acetate kinase
MEVAVLNAGSGSIKAALVEVKAAAATVRVRRSAEVAAGTDVRSAFAAALDGLGIADGDIELVGHRVVHGGRQFVEPAQVDAAVERAIEALGCLAPLHNPLALEGIRVARERFPGRPMVAVFDTAFHANRQSESLHYPLPREVCESLDLFRYGFHGIAHASLAESLAAAEGVAGGGVTAVTLQLGAGCSACAVERGRSIETSMGFSPLGGLPMSTRSGDLDPGVVLGLLRHGYEIEELEDMLTRRSGLKGMTGASDMRDVLRAEAGGDERAAVAVALFVRRVVALVGAYFTLLQGRGALVFGGGIGTHSAEIRARVAAGLGAWNVDLDPDRNSSGAPGRISRDGTRPVYGLETDEERLIARSAHALLEPGEDP